MSYDGIKARLEMYKTPAHREMYVEVRDVGGLYHHYLEDVYLLLLEQDRLEKRLATIEAAAEPMIRDLDKVIQPEHALLQLRSAIRGKSELS